MENPTKSDAILGHKVRVLHPEIAHELQSEPQLKDISFVPKICEAISKIDLPKGGYNFNRTHLIIGVVLHLYDPDVLEGWKRNLMKGIRSQLAALFNVTDTAISNNIQTVRGYYLTHRKYKDYVDSISRQISDIYNNTKK